MSPASAQQRASDPLTRFLDSIFQPHLLPGRSGGEARQPQAAPAPQVQPAPAQVPPAQARTAVPQPRPVEQTAVEEKKQQAAPEPREPASPPPVKAAEEVKPAPAVPASPPEPPKTQEAAAKPAPAPAPAPTPAPASSPAPAEERPAPTPVAVAQAVPNSPADALERLNDYFNGIDRMSAYFVQKSANGQRAEGTLSIKRPGQLHFAYAPPSTLEIVSDGRNVAIRDKKLGTNDVYPVGQTPLKFLVQENFNLARDTKIRDVQIGRGGMVTVRFDDSATFGGTSRITLRFDARANALKQWTVVDSQGYETTVTLSGLNVVRRKEASAGN